MKRSEINAHIDKGIRFLKKMKFSLPPFAYYSLTEWQKAKDRAQEIFSLGLGWDITDFGTGNFAKIGLLLFTMRNGATCHHMTPPAPTFQSN